MELQNETSNQESDRLKAELNGSLSALQQEENKIISFTQDIERHSKLIAALQSENIEMQQEIDRIEIDKNGNIDFKNFDKLSDKINSNERKIKVLQRAVNKLNLLKEQALLTEYYDAKNKYNHDRSVYLKKLLEQQQEKLINNLHEINVLYTVYCMKNDINSISGSPAKDLFFEYLSAELKPHLIVELNDDIDIPFYDKKIIVPDVGAMARRNRLAELETELENI